MNYYMYRSSLTEYNITKFPWPGYISDDQLDTVVLKFEQYLNKSCLIITNNVILNNSIHDGLLKDIIPVNITEDLINSLIKVTPTIECIIIDFSHDIYYFDFELERFNNYNLIRPFFILTCNFSYFKKYYNDTKIIFFSFYLLYSNLSIDKFLIIPKKYKFSCLNSRPDTHRRLFYLALSKQQYFSEIMFSFAKDCPRSYDVNLSKFEHLEFNKLPYPVIIDDNKYLDLTTNHPAYTETYINIVTESYSYYTLVSEKTYKPILAGQLFLIVGAVGSIQFLRDIGIDTFDDIIDHSYDQVEDLRERIELIIKQITYLNNLNLEKIYQLIKPRLIQNSNFLKSDEFINQFLPLNIQ